MPRLPGRRALLVAPLALPLAARAQEAWPSRPVRIVISWPPGGGADIPVRLAAPAMQRALGQPVVLENRAGASGSVGAGVVAQAAPDGYTALADTAAGAWNHLLIPGLPYDFASALTPVSLLARSPLLLVVRADDPAKSLADLLAEMRAKPEQVAWGSSGTGTATHLAPVLMLSLGKASGNHVSYRGGAASIAGLLAGDCRFVFSTLPQSAPLVKEGRLRGLAVSTGQRIASLPEVPTVAEQGFPGFEAISWFGPMAPAGTPAEVIARVNADSNRILAEPAIRERLAVLGLDAVGGTPEAMRATMIRDIPKWASVIREANIRAN